MRKRDTKKRERERVREREKERDRMRERYPIGIMRLAWLVGIAF